jgi:hypothetical protein
VTNAPTLRPPSGDPPPTSAVLGGGEPLDLVAFAGEICRRYRAEFPDEEGRYGEAGNAWCVHDNQHLLFWGAEAVNGHVDMDHEVAWLASVLQARDFPLDRLARNLDIAADVVREQLAAAPGQQLAGVLADSAAVLRSRVTAPGELG